MEKIEVSCAKSDHRRDRTQEPTDCTRKKDPGIKLSKHILGTYLHRWVGSQPNKRVRKEKKIVRNKTNEEPDTEKY